MSEYLDEIHDARDLLGCCSNDLGDLSAAAALLGMGELADKLQGLSLTVHNQAERVIRAVKVELLDAFPNAGDKI